jgi:hypothetical protein
MLAMTGIYDSEAMARTRPAVRTLQDSLKMPILDRNAWSQALRQFYMLPFTQVLASRQDLHLRQHELAAAQCPPAQTLLPALQCPTPHKDA